MGRGRFNPQGRSVAITGEDPVAAWCDALNAIEPAECAWWSPHLWARDYSVAVDWIAAHGCAIDLDYEDPRRGAGKEHTEVPVDSWLALYQSALDGDLPGNLIHGTPRGARLVFVFDRPTTSRTEALAALRAAGALVAEALSRIGLQRVVPRAGGRVEPGFSVDRRALLDLKRIFWAPRCTVAGAAREATVHAFCRDPVSLDELAAAGAEQPAEARVAGASTDYAEAARRWCEDHPIDFGAYGRECPACGHRECFGPLPADPAKWFCFSSNHEADSDGCGCATDQGWLGDALDLEARQRGAPPTDVLRQDGYLIGSALDDIDISRLLDGPASSPAGPGIGRRFRVQTLDEILQLRPPPPIVRGLIREQDLVVLYGAPGCGKSFVAISLALSLSTGTPWMGMEVPSAEHVLYIAGEGTYGIGKRVMAWAGGEISAKSQVWHHWAQINDLVAILDPVQFSALLASIEDMPAPPRLIIVDTLARAMTGGDENSAKDMGLLVHRCGQLRDVTGAAVVLVHHTRTDGERERGSSALRGAADVMLQIERDEGTGAIRLVTVKTKDDQPPEPIDIRLERVVLGTDDDGEEISSLRAVPMPADPSRLDALGGAPMVILGALKDQPRGAPWASVSELMGSTKLHRNTIGRALRELEQHGRVVVRMVGNSKQAAIRWDQVAS